ncbi:hypothetical protein DPEC_G00298800 [Dallia pectoralis]|uniref:Uncharacterized protein n=1 Tax=Dallia pectoralis TaxID=75939 RepID=A0ACC2FG14_DALPE|nr:hypothetical protein DPEC_G00298800 [Dallia pectoralis]
MLKFSFGMGASRFNKEVSSLLPFSPHAAEVYATEKTMNAMRPVWSGGVLLLLAAVLINAQVDENQASSPEMCLMPMEVGPCRAAFPKYFYNVTVQNCSMFVYGGCNSNGNNFDSQGECEAACSGVTGNVLVSKDLEAGPIQRRMASPGDVQATSPEKPLPQMTSDVFAEMCQASPKTGPCRASHRRFFYDSSSGTCQAFTYGGCSGNKNNYETSEQCLTTCTVTSIPSKGRRGPVADVPSEDKNVDYHDACMVAPDSGPCRAAFSMIYYDSDTGSCQSFVYGGCGGNGNRYSSLEECAARCAGATAKHGGRAHWTLGFLLVTVLGVVSVLVLVTLALITIRRSKLQRSHSVRSDKEELLASPVSIFESDPPKVPTARPVSPVTVSTLVSSVWPDGFPGAYDLSGQVVVACVHLVSIQCWCNGACLVGHLYPPSPRTPPLTSTQRGFEGCYTFLRNERLPQYVVTLLISPLSRGGDPQKSLQPWASLSP